MTHDPTGREPSTPVRITQISVTERGQFRKCRRRWFLTEVHRLEGPGEAMFQTFGTVMHEALRVYHSREWGEPQPTQAQMEATLSAFNTHWAEALGEAREELGWLWGHAEPEWTAHEELGRIMLAGYFKADAASRFGGGKYPDLGTPIAAERRYTVKIPGTTGKLTGKLDLVTELPPRGVRRGVDHKNLASQHSSSHLDQDDQLTGYAWLYYEAEGILLDSVAYNVLLKKGPFTPKTGKPTKSELFVRDVTFRSEAQLRQFGENLPREWRDMRKVALHPEEAYPNPSQFNCPGCPVRDICVSMMNEEDTEDVIRSGYVIGDPRD